MAPFRSWRRSRHPDVPVGELELVAVDLETTGLDPSEDEILSIGVVPFRGGVIELGDVRQYAVRPAGASGVGGSAVVHGITDDAAAGAAPLAEVMPLLLEDLRGRVLLAHHAAIEVSFIAEACRTCGIRVPELTVVDTLRLQRRVLHRGRAPGHIADEELSLAASRRHLGLPRYRSHDALTDALACAELYLAQVAALSGSAGLTVRDLLR